MKDTFDNKPLPVAQFDYPRHGTGKMVTRFVRVTEMNEDTLTGFEIESEFDEEPGKIKSFTISKMAEGRVYLLHLDKTEE